MPYKDLKKRKEYQDKYNKIHYRKNSEYYKDKAKEFTKNSRKKTSQFIDRYKLLCGCKICGYKKSVKALEFHHLRDKFKIISVMVRNCFSRSAIKEEIRKCILLCANCHRETHTAAPNKINTSIV